MARPLLTRQASEGLDYGCGSYTSCIGTCSNSVARPRSSPANHDKSCFGVIWPPSPPRNPTWNPWTAYPIVRGRRRRGGLEKARGCVCHGDSMFGGWTEVRMLHYGVLQPSMMCWLEIDGTGKTGWMANTMAPQFKPYRSSAWWCPGRVEALRLIGGRGAAQPKGSPWLAVTPLIAGLALVPARLLARKSLVPLSPTIHVRMSRGAPD